MNIKFYHCDEKVISGITLKDSKQREMNNMALHSCRNEADIVSNRQQLAEALQLPLENFVLSQQTHSDNAYEVLAEDKGRGTKEIGTAISDTDALYTFEKNIVLATLTADCVPVIFYSEVDELIGVIHSGWQGTTKEITRKLLQKLVNEAKCDITQLHVQIGMAISQQRFEVDADVYTLFKQLGYADADMYYDQEKQKYFIDNQNIVRKQCELAGVVSEHIQMDRSCTFNMPEGFSYREDNRAGRHLSFILQK